MASLASIFATRSAAQPRYPGIGALAARFGPAFANELSRALERKQRQEAMSMDERRLNLYEELTRSQMKRAQEQQAQQSAIRTDLMGVYQNQGVPQVAPGGGGIIPDLRGASTPEGAALAQQIQDSLMNRNRQGRLDALNEDNLRSIMAERDSRTAANNPVSKFFGRLSGGIGDVLQNYADLRGKAALEAYKAKLNKKPTPPPDPNADLKVQVERARLEQELRDLRSGGGKPEDIDERVAKYMKSLREALGKGGKWEVNPGEPGKTPEEMTLPELIKVYERVKGTIPGIQPTAQGPRNPALHDAIKAQLAGGGSPSMPVGTGEMTDEQLAAAIEQVGKMIERLEGGK